MEERLREAPCGFMSIDQNGCVVEVNNRFLTWMGYRQEEVVGKHIETFLTRVNGMFLHSYFFPTIQLHGTVEELYINMLNSTGESFPFLLNARRYMQGDAPIIDCVFILMKQRIDYEMELRTLQKTTENAYEEREKAFAQLEKIYVEIEKKQHEILEMNDQLLTLSNTDKLTGIPNRRFYEEELRRHMKRYEQEGIAFSLAMIDIDHFKKVNDTYGHLTGDDVLIRLANVLTEEIRPGDKAARLGGEEFIIIFPDTDAETATELAVKLKQAVSSTKWDKIEQLTVSIGVSTFSESDTQVTILDLADRALYTAKARGRNCAVHYREVL